MATRQPKVLIADDDRAVLALIGARLRQRAFHVKMVRDGQAAMEALYQDEYDLLLLDLMMPKVTGYEVLERTRQDPAFNDMPIIVMSAISDMASVVKCIELGAEDYLFKPFHKSLFWARVNTLVEKKQLRDQEKARARELALLQQLDRQMNARLDTRHAARLALDLACNNTGAALGAIGSGGPESEVWALCGTADADSFRQLLSTLPVQVPQEPLADFLPDENRLATDAAHRVIIPIEHRSEALGYMVLHYAEEPDEEQIHFLELLARHAAIALGNALLHQRVNAENAAKSDFLAFVAHELKSPLTVLQAYSELINHSNGAKRLLTTQEKYLNILEGTVSRMNRLVSELNDIAAIESGRLAIHPQPMQLLDLLDEILLRYEPVADEKSLTVSMDVSPGLPVALGDRQRVEQVLVNLLSNAIKYTPAGGWVRISVEPTFTEDGACIQIAVADNGFGIAAEDQRGIFRQFFRTNDVVDRGIQGVGLGLSIARTLVERQGGKIWFESELGTGTTFYFTLPTAPEAPLSHEMPQPEESAALS